MTVSIYANGTKIPDEKLPDLQIWNQTLQDIFDDVLKRVGQNDGGRTAASRISPMIVI